MGKREKPVELEPAYFDVLVKVALGRKTPTTIKKVFTNGKTVSTIHAQLQALTKLGFVNYEKEYGQYTMNYENLSQYYAKEFGIKKQILDEKLPMWIKLIGATPVSLGMSINGFGTTLKLLSLPKTIIEEK